MRDLLLNDSMLKMETQREVRALKISRRQRFGSRSFCSSLLLVPIRFELLARYEPALGVTPKSTKPAVGKAVQWDASLPWAFAMSAVAAIAIVSMGDLSEFLYWQF